MTSGQFNLNLISKYRAPLMGLSAIMIILCHSLVHKVPMPGAIAKLLNFGNLGVDIFLFLSGMGLYFSLNKLSESHPHDKKTILPWYKKRFIRILIPYLYLSIPFWVVVVLNERESIGDFFIHLSTLGFWLYHEGAWFIAFLIPLYFLTPWIFKLHKKYRLACLVLWSIAILLCTFLNSSSAPYTFSDNLIFCLRRLPSFLIGLILAPYIKDGFRISYLKLGIILLIIGLALVVFKKLDKDTAIDWILMLYLVIFFTLFLKFNDYLGHKINTAIASTLTFFGTISLESYLTNIYLGHIFKDYIFKGYTTGIPYERYISYSCIIVFGILLAWGINKISTKHISTISHQQGKG